MTYMADDPRDLVSLSRVAGLVTEFFDLEDAVEYDTPFVWWDRSKRNLGISDPMPEPVGYGGQNGRGPLWYQEQIIHWFGQWRDLEIPVCREAGDRVNNRGGTVPSKYRAA